MISRQSLSLILVLPLILCSGCATTKAKPEVKSELARLYEKDFEGLKIPDAEKIKEVGLYKSFPYVSYNDIWNAAIIVLIQHGIITYLSKDSSVMIVVGDPPLSLFIQRDKESGVYLSSLYKFYPKKLYKISPEESLAFAQNSIATIEKNANAETIFFDKLATQAYAKDKWKYLYK